jgi:hypothetical protein
VVPRFKSAVRSVLDNIGEGLLWMGLTWGGMYPPFRTNAPRAADPDRFPTPPLSKEEQAEWAALVERLR